MSPIRFAPLVRCAGPGDRDCPSSAKVEPGRRCSYCSGLRKKNPDLPREPKRRRRR